jgi:beta-lactamase regulating signal transducer with metallopeptidase domain
MLAIQILSRPEIQRLSLTLLHFVWQGVVVAVMTAAVVFALRLRHGRARYAAYLLGFSAMLICPIFTYLTLRQPSVASMSNVEDSAPVMHTPSPEATEPQPVRLKSFNEAHVPVAQATERERWRERGREWLSAALPWVPAAWAVGVMLLGARLLTGVAGVRRWKRGASDLPAPLLARVDQLGTRIGLPGFRRVFASPHVGQPSAVGFWKPVVILPLALVAQMPPDMLDAVIAHELAHLRRLDPLVNLAQRLVETLLFYHPAVWWLSGQIRREREICCDELAVAATERMTYVSALEHVARFTLGLSPATYVQGLALTFGGRRQQVLHRIKHLLDMPGPRAGTAWPAGALALVVVLAGLGISRSAAQKPQSAPAIGRGDVGLGETSETRTSVPATREAKDNVAAEHRLLTPMQDTKEQAREQAVRDQRRAELDVQEAKVTLEAKKKDFDRAASAHDKHLVSQEEFDHAQLAVTLGQIQLERSQLELENARAKTQSFSPSSVSLSFTGAGDEQNSKVNYDSKFFSVRTRRITLRELLDQRRDRLDEITKNQGEGRLTLVRPSGGTAGEKVIDGVPLQDVLSGKVKDQALQAGDEVVVFYEGDIARDVHITAPDAKPASASWRRLPRRNMTLTQVLAISKFDLKGIAEQKVILDRKIGPDVVRIVGGVPIRDLIDGTVKDKIIQSGDRIELYK